MSGKTKKKTSEPAGHSATAPVSKDAEGVQSQAGAPDQAPLAPASDVNGPESQPVATDPAGTADPVPAAGLSQATGTAPDTANNDDATVTVLEVRAIPEGGFHRAGRFWPHDVVHVFVSDNPDEQVIEDDRGQPLYGCVISTADAKRLKAEKMLVVTELATVTAPGAEDA